MNKLIVEQDFPVTLVGGGALDPDDLAVARSVAPVVVAADGGANTALKHGVTPDFVIGDFDSISAGTQAELGAARLLHVPEQDTTDFDKALRAVSVPLVLAVGFLGARIDHQLAALNVLMQPHPSPCILIGEHEILFHLRHPVSVPTDEGDVVSLFPMRPVTGVSDGLQWPIQGLTLDPMHQIGTSNRAVGPCSLRSDGPGLIVILPKKHLLAVVDTFIRRPEPEA